MKALEFIVKNIFILLEDNSNKGILEKWSLEFILEKLSKVLEVFAKKGIFSKRRCSSLLWYWFAKYI